MADDRLGQAVPRRLLYPECGGNRCGHEIRVGHERKLCHHVTPAARRRLEREPALADSRSAGQGDQARALEQLRDLCELILPSEEAVECSGQLGAGTRGVRRGGLGHGLDTVTQRWLLRKCLAAIAAMNAHHETASIGGAVAWSKKFIGSEASPVLYLSFTTPVKKAGSAQTGAGAARTASARPFASKPAVKANAAVGKAGFATVLARNGCVPRGRA